MFTSTRLKLNSSLLFYSDLDKLGLNLQWCLKELCFNIIRRNFLVANETIKDHKINH